VCAGPPAGDRAPEAKRVGTMAHDVDATLTTLERRLEELERELSGRSHEPAAAPPAPPAAAAPDPFEQFGAELRTVAGELVAAYDRVLALGRASPPGRRALRLGRMAGPQTISFARGAPSLDIIDVDGLRECAGRAFERDPGGTTAYGTSVGYVPLREWIADEHGVDVEQVLVTNGSMQADAFLFDDLVGDRDTVVVERPTYDRTLLGLRERGADIRMIDLEPDGVDVEALGRLLREGMRPCLAHIIPNFQNPAGYTLSRDKRDALLHLAADHEFVIFEDDPYVHLRFSGEGLPTMLSLDRDERVVYASSFSKTVCPGIRVGYLVGPREVIARIAKRATNTYIAPNMVAQSIVYEFCSSGRIRSSIETVKKALAERVELLAAALERELPDARFTPPEGGYFMWVELPEGTDVDAMFTAAGERGVAFVKGTDFLLEGGRNTLRLAYSGVTSDQIDEGVARLAEAYRQQQKASTV
jgi:2-aminoadipate transaminase